MNKNCSSIWYPVSRLHYHTAREKVAHTRNQICPNEIRFQSKSRKRVYFTFMVSIGWLARTAYTGVNWSCTQSFFTLASALLACFAKTEVSEHTKAASHFGEQELFLNLISGFSFALSHCKGKSSTHPKPNMSKWNQISIQSKAVHMHILPSW